MRIEQKTVVVTYPVFEVGEIVRPTSRRAGLPPGNYVVTRYIEPRHAETVGTVFVAGQQYGVGTEFLAPVTEAHQLGEPPAGFVPLYWDDTHVGQEVWLWGLSHGQPHAYGPHHVVSPAHRELINPHRARFQHLAQDLLIPHRSLDAALSETP